MANDILSRVQCSSPDGKDVTREVMKKLFPKDGIPSFSSLIPVPEGMGKVGSPFWRLGLAFLRFGTGGTERQEVPEGLIASGDEELKSLAEREWGSRKPEDRKALTEAGKAALANYAAFGSPCMSEWLLENWGTGENASGAQWDGDALEYITPWSPADGILKKVSSQCPGVMVMCDWKDLDDPCSSGFEAFRSGVQIVDIQNGAGD